MFFRGAVFAVEALLLHAPDPAMLVHQLPIEEAFTTLRSHADGLSSAEAGGRLAEFGPNRIERVRSVPVSLRLVRQFTHFFAMLLWCAAVLAFVADVYMPGQGMGTLGVAIVAVILINGVFSFWQEDRAERTMAALQRLLPHRVRARRDGSAVVIPSEEVVPGDVIFLTAGDDVPADCRLLEAFGVRVNNATLTGEARPASRDIRADAEGDLLRTRNVLLAGTAMMAGEAKALVFCLTAIVLMQVVNVFLCRSRRASAFTRPLTNNRLLLGGVVGELVLILLIDYTRAGQAIFGTAAIGLGAWLVVVPFGLAMVFAEEVRKAVVRLREPDASVMTDQHPRGASVSGPDGQPHPSA